LSLRETRNACSILESRLALWLYLKLYSSNGEHLHGLDLSLEDKSIKLLCICIFLWSKWDKNYSWYVNNKILKNHSIKIEIIFSWSILSSEHPFLNLNKIKILIFFLPNKLHPRYFYSHDLEKAGPSHFPWIHTYIHTYRGIYLTDLLEELQSIL